MFAVEQARGISRPIEGRRQHRGIRGAATHAGRGLIRDGLLDLQSHVQDGDALLLPVSRRECMQPFLCGACLGRLSLSFISVKS